MGNHYKESGRFKYVIIEKKGVLREEYHRKLNLQFTINKPSVSRHISQRDISKVLDSRKVSNYPQRSLDAAVPWLTEQYELFRVQSLAFIPKSTD